MRQSQLFTKTRKEAPSGEEAKNAQLLIRGGFINKEMAGAYSFLPLGLRVIEKIKKIVREEMNAIGGQEIIMTSLQRKELWESTDRWDDEKVDVWFKSQLKSGGEVGFGWSHEEPISDMMKQYVSSYRDLPVYVYQFQTKLRNELRAKSGIMRGREFGMKDLYSYTTNEEDHKKFYESVIVAYKKVFKRAGLGDITHFTFASGGAFTQFSHEFQTETSAGEDIVYIDRKKGVAINQEVLNDEVLNQLGVSRGDLEEVKTAEVGNIFSFGGTKSEQLGLMFKDETGESKPVILGSYGIGITRLMGTIVEIFSDAKGIIWPKEVAPFEVHLVLLPSEKARIEADNLYKELTDVGIEALYDDRDLRAGEKFADSDLLGIPTRIIVSDRALEQGGFEVVDRKTGESRIVPAKELLATLK